MYTNDFKEYECQNTLENIMDAGTFYLCTHLAQTGLYLIVKLPEDTQESRLM